MNTVTLDSMAFDNFEVAGTPVLSEAEGGSVLGGIIVGAGAGFVGAMKGAEEGASGGAALSFIPVVGPYMEAGCASCAIGGAVIGGISGAYAGYKIGDKLF
ncbi:hypothetical protein [Streptococcus sobrinus]|uniref:hypothetical protein n=1 Tax=Streptococcus sobrinus TaxID=1310 RepID=UPI0002FCC904|nr:hypothetical protein [Streptococcus sobrinus]AWN61044.1 hypothetical protein DLJ52_01995 [Streptococcus sobrinus]AWN62917.1 hypothetical protein DLJ51_01995 [Streptococcus sobrinus]SQG18934.1 Uncharacterised protein [Streptococcus sobrinus]